jgi:hypothetical protein
MNVRASARHRHCRRPDDAAGQRSFRGLYFERLSVAPITRLVARKRADRSVPMGRVLGEGCGEESGVPEEHRAASDGNSELLGSRTAILPSTCSLCVAYGTLRPRGSSPRQREVLVDLVSDWVIGGYKALLHSNGRSVVVRGPPFPSQMPADICVAPRASPGRAFAR